MSPFHDSLRNCRSVRSVIEEGAYLPALVVPLTSSLREPEFVNKTKFSKTVAWVTTIPRGGKAPRKYYSVFFCNFAMLRTVMDSTNRLRIHNFETCLNFDCRSSTVNVPTFEEEACVFESPHSLLTDSAFRATLQ